MRLRREPAWWMLYGLLPLMGGLFVMESRLALPPGWRKCVQIGIILFAYGLVWIWLWVNDQALLREGQDLPVKDETDTANGGEPPSRGPGGIPPQADGSDVRGHPTPRRIMTRINAREIRKCSHSLGRRSSRSCS
jgi:hypothetical protein